MTTCEAEGARLNFQVADAYVAWSVFAALQCLRLTPIRPNARPSGKATGRTANSDQEMATASPVVATVILSRAF
jgi:hypothetical protein